MLKKIKSKGLELHIRSAFLQGLCFINPDKLKGNLKLAKSYLTKFRLMAKHMGISYEELALSYLLNINEIDCLILGCTSKNELNQNYKIIKNYKPLQIEYEQFGINNDKITNPSNWTF